MKTLIINIFTFMHLIIHYFFILASYGVEDPEFAITQLAQTTMRSELGQISLDKVFRERESLNVSIVHAINKASEAWGITCLRYEIRKNLINIIYLFLDSFLLINLISLLCIFIYLPCLSQIYYIYIIHTYKRKMQFL